MHSEDMKKVVAGTAAVVVGSVEAVADRIIHAITAVCSNEFFLMVLTVVGMAVLMKSK